MGYWEDRQEQAYLAAEQKADAYFKELKASFRQAKREIEYAINDFTPGMPMPMAFLTNRRSSCCLRRKLET